MYPQSVNTVAIDRSWRVKSGVMRSGLATSIAALALCCWQLVSNQAFAQDIEPRRWTPLPLGTNVLAAGYARTSGDVGFSPVLQIKETKVEADSVAVSYVRSFALAGKPARIDVLVPRDNARWDGLLSGEPASAHRVGLADPRLRLSMTFFGAPAADASELRSYMASRPINTVVGAAIAVTVPLGEYFEDRLLNLGRNRYTIRPQIGVVHTRGPWSFELTGSMFLFTDNDSFFDGSTREQDPDVGTREQDPIYALQAHVVRIFAPGLWASLSAGYGTGGRSTIDGVAKNDAVDVFLSAISFGFPIAQNQGVKVAYLIARTQNDSGADTDTVALSWSVRF
jgi:hypothetical protein